MVQKSCHRTSHKYCTCKCSHSISIRHKKNYKHNKVQRRDYKQNFQ
nr:unnamed protein product [Callosobruchus analis]